MAVKTPEEIEASVARMASNAREVAELARSVANAQAGSDVSTPAPVVPLVSPSNLGVR